MTSYAISLIELGIPLTAEPGILAFCIGQNNDEYSAVASALIEHGCNLNYSDHGASALMLAIHFR